MLEDDDGPTTATIDLTDRFVDAGVAKLDAVFGAGYTRENPAMLSAYLAACASNLNAFMTAATMMQDEIDFEEAMKDYEQEIAKPAAKPKGRRR